MCEVNIHAFRVMLFEVRVNSFAITGYIHRNCALVPYLAGFREKIIV